MGFILDGKSQGSPLCQDMMSRYSGGMERQAGIDAVMTFGVEQAFLSFDDPSRRCRPFLTLLGRVQEVVGRFPYGVEAVRYQDTEERSLVSYRYDLTRANLAEMVAKGLFDEGFEVPEIIRENVFELPCKVTCTALAPEEPGMPPVVFADIEASSMQCTDDTSGYTISEYFRAVPEPGAETLLAPEDRLEGVYERTLEDQRAVYADVSAPPVPEEEGMEAPEADMRPKEGDGRDGERPARGRDASDVRSPEPAAPEEDQLFV